MQQFSIRQRILIIFILIVVLGSTVQLFIAGYQLQATTLEFYQHHLETDALLIGANLSEPMEDYHEAEGTAAIQRFFAHLQQDLNHGYLIVDDHYKVVAYSANMGYESIERLAETPELLEAREQDIGADIRANWKGVETLYLAVPLIYEQDILGFLVLYEPMQPAYDEVMHHWLELGLSFLPVVVMVVLGSIWISGTIVNPIQNLRDSALKMADGKFNIRIEEAGSDETAQLAKAFNYMAGQIESLMKTQRSFVSYAAHELRTPLMTLKLRAEILQDERISQNERSKYLQEISAEVNHMANLVSSLLILSRIDEGRSSQPADTGIDKALLLHDITRQWRVAAENHGLAFQAEIPEVLPNFKLPSAEFRLILDNLLSNAIKYTTAGSVSLKVLSNHECCIQISDTGMGFAANEAEHLFERFYRAQSVQSQIRGHGLGLAIVKAILEQYGGSIQAESAGLGKGASFTVCLPLAD